MLRLLNNLSLILTFAVLISASPTPYTEDNLSEIDTLRARGISEVSYSVSVSVFCPSCHSLPLPISKDTYISSSQAEIAARISHPESLSQPIPDPVHIDFGIPETTNPRSLWSRSMTEILDSLVEKLGVKGSKKDEIVSELKAKGESVTKRDEGQMWVSGKLGQIRVRGMIG